LEDWALIRRLHVSERLPKVEIARQLGISRNTVEKAVASVRAAVVLAVAGDDEFRYTDLGARCSPRMLDSVAART